MNTLILVDISLWKNRHLVMLIEMFVNFVEGKVDDNRLLLCHNPLMNIALSAELLTKIANSREKFKNECTGLKEQILDLGKTYISKITDEKYFTELMMDTDYQNRTTLKIITSCQLEELMVDQKAENLMQTIYIGKEATQCDGTIYGYSNFLNILTGSTDKIENTSNYMDIATYKFQLNT